MKHQMVKAAWRKRIREALAPLSTESRVTASAVIRERLVHEAPWRGTHSVLLYAPLPDEPDIFPLLDQALSQGKTVCLPGYLSAEDRYEARIVRSLERDLVLGHYGIREPRADCAILPLNRLDLVLVPGVAFSPAGSRLGRGKGYYDRLLARVHGIKCGVGFDEQLVSELPSEPHDMRLDWILTPSRWCRASAGARL